MANLEEDCIGFELKLTKNVMESEYNKYFKKYGISNEQALLLAYVYECPGITQTQIAEQLLKNKTTITRMIDTLVKAGRLERKSSTEDRRVFHIYISKEAGDMIKELTPLFEKRDEDVKELIGEKDYQTTIEVLKKIREYYKGLNQ